MSSSSDNNTPQSADEFAQHLRTRAEQAVAASVQYANLSERYLDLSRQFASLAEKASAASPSDLEAALKAIESAMVTSSGSLSSAVGHIEAGQGPEVSEPPVEGGFAALGESPVAALAQQADLTDLTDTNTSASNAPAPDDQSTAVPSGGTVPDSLMSQSDTDTAAVRKARRRSGRIQTRTFVERVRSARLALARRVKVKANKEDLKPQQRKTLEELNKSRGSIVTSLVMMVVVMFLLSLISLQFDVDVPVTSIMASFADEIAEIEEPLPIEIPEEESGEQQEEEVEEPVEEPVEEVEEPAEEPELEPMEAPLEEADAPEAEVEVGEIPAANDGAADVAAVDNRSEAGRKKMLGKFGGSAASESAVQRGLEWIVSVQHPRGWWDFTQVGEAGSPGKINNPIGATAYALMPFLAAGQTHTEGEYQKQVRAGLDYLGKVGVSAPAGYDLRGVVNKGNEDKDPNEAYYVHGAATLVLCEAYGMTKDRRLRKSAEGALGFLLNSQDPRGGGWRYLPQQPGSTSVTAIQVMALMAAKKAGLKVPSQTLEGVMHYLDSVQVDGEGRYGYETEKKTYKGSATAMALLCRMYLGWGRDDGDMRAGIALLDKAGPYENLYTTYFATQVMRNWGGEPWTRWNERMRDDLIATQITDGAGQGSWKPRTGMHTKQGGRLLETSLATLTLEVYYRYEPVLPEVAVDGQQVVVE
jgi:hypothetical protein